MAAEGFAALSPNLATPELEQLLHGSAAPVALTGATGFVGSHLLDALRRAQVPRRLLVRGRGRLRDGSFANEEVLQGSLEDEAALRALVRDAGWVVHVAGLVRAGRASDFDRANAAGTARLVEAMASVAPRARLIFVSSLAAAGPSAAPAGRAPDDPPAPMSAYGRSKLRGEQHVRTWGGPWVILRPPAIYGPRERDVWQFFRLAARGVVPLPAGERWVTVAHVTDVVRAILAASHSGTRQILHLGEPSPYRLDELVATLARAGGLAKPRMPVVPGVLLRAAGLVGDALQRLGAHGVAMTSDKARELLARHWTAVTAPSLTALGLVGCVRFEDGARTTWMWYRQHGWVSRATIRWA